VLALYVGAAWLKRIGRSQEWFDSCVIFIYGVISTFTLHQGPLTKWSHKDLQHVALGVMWWSGGALGIYLCRGGRRSVIPSLIVIMTGWAISVHEQAIPISTKVHTVFGVVLASAGITRIFEICFILRDAPSLSMPGEDAGSAEYPPIHSLQYLPPYLLVAGGLLLIGATDDEMRYIASLEVDHVTYSLIMLSLAFIIYLYAIFLINLYLTSGKNAVEGGTTPGAVKPTANGYHAVPSSRPELPGLLHDAEAYELDDQFIDELQYRSRAA